MGVHRVGVKRGEARHRNPGNQTVAHPALPSPALHLGIAGCDSQAAAAAGLNRAWPTGGRGRGGDRALRAAAPKPAEPSAARAEPSGAEPSISRRCRRPAPRAPAPHPLQHPAAGRTPDHAWCPTCSSDPSAPRRPERPQLSRRRARHAGE